MKHVLRISIVTVVVVLIVQALTVTFASAEVSEPGPGETDAGVAVLPTTDCGHYFIAEVTINGHGPYSMLLDSGAGTTTITRRVAEEAGVKRRISTLDIGRFRARGRMPCKIRSMTQLSGGLGVDIDGIVGHPVFRGVLLTYDFPAREVRVETGALDDDDPGVVRTARDRRPFVDASIGGRTVRVLVDTGSGHGLSLTKMDRYDFDEEPVATSARVRIDGLYLTLTARLAGDVVIGPLTLARPIVRNSVSVNLLGHEVLDELCTTFDIEENLVRIERPGRPPDEAMTFEAHYGMGLAIDPGADEYVVVRVFDGMPAAEAGLVPGDVIVAIDGKRIGERGCEGRAGTIEEPTDVVLTVRREDEVVDIVVRADVLVK